MSFVVRPTVTATLLERVARTPEQIAFRVPQVDNHEAGSWKTRTFAEFFADVELAGFGFLAVGLLPQDRVALISNTRYEWTWVDFAVQGACGILVPIYPSSTAHDIQSILAHAEARVLVVENREQLSKVLALYKSSPESIAHLHRILVLDPQAMVIAGPAHAGDLAPRILSFQALLELGRRLQTQDPGRIRKNMASVLPTDLITISYTSGTTGEPKGVAITHDNVVSVFEDVASVFERDLIADRESTLSFLPYSHIIGRVESLVIHVFGWQCSFAPNLDDLMSHLMEVKPTVIFAVPRIFEKAYAHVYSAFAAADRASRVKRKLMDWSLLAARKRDEGLLWAVGAEVSKKAILRFVRNRFGGRLKFAICGGAPLPQAVGEFFEQIGILALEGYGLTETCGPVVMNTPRSLRYGSVGKPLPETQIKIAEDGEICIKSRKVFREYWKMPEETQSTFHNDWLKTGDIGHFDKDGYLWITDRKKDLIITSGGKNVAPQKIETLAKAYPALSYLVVIGERRHFLSALICLDRVWVERYAQENGILYSGFRELLKNPKILAVVEQAIQSLNQSLASFETIKRFLILEDEFSQDSGELTPSLKIRRAVITEKYKTEIDKIYSAP